VAFGLIAATAASAAEFQVHGLLDLVAAQRGEAYESNLFMRGDSPFDAYRLRLFADAQVSERMQIFSQIVLDDATSPYVDGAYLLFTPMLSRDAHVIAGKVPWAIGTYAPRTYSNKNPLVGTPLMYQYHTTLLWWSVEPNADALLAKSGTGQAGYNGHGMTLVDDSYWDVGITITGSERPLEYAIGLVAGTPGWGSTTQDENSGKSVLGRIGLAPWPGIRLGCSGAYGPYLMQSVGPSLPQGRDANDYHQKLGMADVELLVGHVELRAEGARNLWETPNVGELGVTSGYGELKYSLSFGAFLAGRYDVLRFDEIEDSGGNKRPWDSNVERYEAGAGYRFNRNTVAKAIYQRTSVKTEGAPEENRRAALAAAQVSVSF